MHADHARTWAATATPSRAARAVRVYSLQNPKRPRRVATFATPAACSPARVPRPGAHQERPLGCVHRRSGRGRPPALSVALRCQRRDAWLRPLRRQPPRSPTAALDREHASGRGLTRALATGRRQPRVRLHGDPAGRARGSPDGIIPANPDFRIYDVSDPKHLVQVGQWGIWANLGIKPAFNQFVHSVITNAAATRAYLSYWEYGTVILDISDPSRPQHVSTLRDPAQLELPLRICVAHARREGAARDAGVRTVLQLRRDRLPPAL